MRALAIVLLGISPFLLNGCAGTSPSSGQAAAESGPADSHWLAAYLDQHLVQVIPLQTNAVRIMTDIPVRIKDQQQTRFTVYPGESFTMATEQGSVRLTLQGVQGGGVKLFYVRQFHGTGEGFVRDNGLVTISWR